ncbi:MAG: tRNA pseudouridine(55) synthase TruB [Deltaproteobacteria bacterium]|nr:tRNA pseudouridine(55) synthase TruB [Deltaproteobacteria bacterium]
MAKSLTYDRCRTAVPAIEAGVFLVDKPVGPTSFRVVQWVRRALGIKKTGHTGTLDPFASGLLIICAGRPATKIIPQLMAGDKEYEALLQLGKETDTQDLAGRVIAESPVPDLSDSEVRICLSGFIGEQLQTPPAFSALKHKGKPLYHYARKGIMIAKEPRPVVIRQIDLLSRTADELAVRVRCGKGVYIRTLAADIGRVLGCGAHLRALRRTVNGAFSVNKAVCGAELAVPERGREILLDNIHPVAEVLERLNKIDR